MVASMPHTRHALAFYRLASQENMTAGESNSAGDRAPPMDPARSVSATWRHIIRTVRLTIRTLPVFAVRPLYSGSLPFPHLSHASME